MQTKRQILNNGQELQTSDFNAVATAAALADDAVLAELLRVPKFGTAVRGVVNNVYRAVMPFYASGYKAGSATPAAGIVQPIASGGGVTLLPFRAVIGPRAGVDGAAEFRDIRTVVFNPGAEPLTTPIPSTFAANVTPFSFRWDLIYATVLVDANQTAETRYLKDPTTKLVSQVSVVTQVATTISISIQAGTLDLNPVFPATPSDPVGGYVIPIAYVRIGPGFGATSTVLPADICEIAVIAPTRGQTATCDQVSTVTSAQQQAWGGGGARPVSFMPTTISGGEVRKFFALDVSDASSANWNLASGDVLDSSIDWRNRIFKASIAVNNAGPKWAWDPGATNFTAVPGYAQVTFSTVQVSAAMDNATVTTVVYLDPTNTDSFVAGGATVALLVDSATGNMKVTVAGTPLVKVFIWLEASGAFPHQS